MQRTLHARRHARLRANAGSDAGFSLVEVTVVALIMGFMFVSVAQVMQLAKRTRDTIHNFQETELAGPAILEMLMTDLNAISVLGRERASWFQVTDRTVNGLDADRIDFVTTTDSLIVEPADADEDPLRADINEVGYMLRESEDNDEFLEIWRREDMGVDDKPFKEGAYTFLSNQVKGFNIEVFEEDGVDAEPIDEWGPDAGNDERIGLPVYVKITLTIELKPRINAESMDFSGSDRRTMNYIRFMRFPDALRFEDGAIPRIALPPGVGTGTAATGDAESGEGDDTMEVGGPGFSGALEVEAGKGGGGGRGGGADARGGTQIIERGGG